MIVIGCDTHRDTHTCAAVRRAAGHHDAAGAQRRGIEESVRLVAQQLMEAEVSELIGAKHGERRPDDRATHRNGYRARQWDTRAGEIELQIPRLRQGSSFPGFLTPRKHSEQALVSVVQQAYVCGVSTRRGDQLVASLGIKISKSDDEAPPVPPTTPAP